MHKLFQRIEKAKEGMCLICGFLWGFFYEANTPLLIKPNKDIDLKEKVQANFSHEHRKILKEILANQIQQYIRIWPYDQIGFRSLFIFFKLSNAITLPDKGANVVPSTDRKACDENQYPFIILLSSKLGIERISLVVSLF